MREGYYQNYLIAQIKIRLPGCIVIKNDSSYQQGIPDLLILWNDRWAALEVKTSLSAPVQRNQEYWIDHMNDMAYAAFIYPENENEVLNDLEFTFAIRR